MLVNSNPRPLVAITIVGMMVYAGVSVRDASRSIMSPAGTHTLEVVLDDIEHCASLDAEASMFCRQDLPDARAEIVRQMMVSRSKCDHAAFESYGPSVGLAEFHDALQQPGDDFKLPWSSFNKEQVEKDDGSENWELWTRYFPNVTTSQGDVLYGENARVSVDHCTTAAGDDGEKWTFERVGPFVGHGAEWHSAGWLDGGRFASVVSQGVWVTAFGFFPVDADYNMIGLPPIHIHHMHVTASQSMARAYRRTKDGSEQAVEFDVHGDRQCKAGMGGMNCTVRGFPPGFGMKLTDSMEVFFDLKDVRAANSPALTFYAQHVYRWTMAAQRPFGKFMGGLSPYTFGSVHDDYMLLFDPARQTEYMYWQEFRMSFSGKFVHWYWHSHHQYAAGQWAVSGSANALGLQQMFGGQYVNLTSIGSSAVSAKQAVLARILSAQTEYLSKPKGTYPALRCSAHKDRWEQVGENQFEGRYHIPHCAPWEFVEGDRWVLMAFHKWNSDKQPLTKRQYVWMHSGIYGYYVATPASKLPIKHAVGVTDMSIWDRNQAPWERSLPDPDHVTPAGWWKR